MVQIHQGKRGKYNNAKTGKYIPLNPHKYLGTTLPIFKSELERLCMAYLDKSDNIVSWSYEPQSIRYFDKATGRVRRYYIDFVAIAKIGNLKKTIWIEIKPKCETIPPKNKKNLQAMSTFLTNTCKWEAARMLAASKGYQFAILTEEQLKL